MNIILLMIVSFRAAACGSTTKYEETLNSYVGSTEHRLIERWGVPDSVYEATGTKYLTYDKSREYYIAGTPPTYQTTCSFGSCTSIPIGGSPGYMLNRRRRTIFLVSGGTVTSWRWQGNACYA